MLVAQTLEDPMRRVPLLARHVRIGVSLQDRVDDATETLQLRPPNLLRPAVDAEPPARFPVAQTLLDNRQPNRRIKFHAVHPPHLVATDKGP